jgi:hypothetical protein
MAERGGRPGFPLKPLAGRVVGKPVGQNLDGHVAIQWLYRKEVPSSRPSDVGQTGAADP